MRKNTLINTILILLVSLLFVGCSGEKKVNSEEKQSETNLEIESEVMSEFGTEIESEIESKVNSELNTEINTEVNTEIDTETKVESETPASPNTESTTKPNNPTPSPSPESQPTTYPDCPYTLFEATFSDGYFHFYHDGTHAGYGMGYNSIGELFNKIKDDLFKQYPKGTTLGFSVEGESYEIMGLYKNISPNIPDSEYMRVVYIKTPLVVTLPAESEEELPSCTYTLNTICTDPFSAEFYYLESEDTAVVSALAAEAFAYVQERREFYISQGRTEDEVQLVRMEAVKVDEFKEGIVYKYTYAVYIP